MVIGITVKAAAENGPASPRTPISPRLAEVGEIDTRAPFQSVKAAVTLFGEVVSPRSATPVPKKLKDEERVFEKETQHHTMLRERGYYINQLKCTEATRAQASRELQRASATLQLLTHRFEALNESKQTSIKATEEAKVRAKELEEYRARRAQLGNDAWKVDVNIERELCKATTAKLVARNQELSNLSQDFDAALVAKTVVFQRAQEAEQKARLNWERQREVLGEVDELKRALEQVKLASLRAKEEHMKLVEEKEKTMMGSKLAKEEVEKEIKRLQEENEPVEALKEKLEETTEEIRVLQEKLNDDYFILRKLGVELVNATKQLEEAVAEENSLQSSVVSLKHELEEVEKKLPETEKRAVEAVSSTERMQVELEMKKAELERAMSGSVFATKLSIEGLLAEAEKARHEAEDSKKNAKLSRLKAKESRTALREAQEKLKAAIKEAEAAKAAEKHAEEQVYNYSRSEAAEPHRKIRLSVEEFESMNKRIEESRKEADLKVATAIAEVEAINAREKGNLEKLEVILKESKAIEVETNEALKSVENAEAAKRMVESELQKWHQNEKNAVGKPSKRRIFISY